MAQIQLRHIAKWHRHTARLRKRRDRKLRPVRPSHRNELWYRAELQGIVRQLRAAGVAVAEDLKANWQAHAADGARSRVADETVPGLSAALQRAASRFGRIGEQAKRLAALAAQRNREEVDQRLADTIEQSIGVNVTPLLGPDKALGAAVEEATRANVDLIESLPAEYLDDLRETVTEAWSSGLRWEELVDEIAERGDVAENRAWLIARDQTSKMNASFNEARQTELGIDEYEWSGTLDERERPSHRALEGTKHRWDDPPLVDDEHVHPGEAINCRCVAKPIFHLEEGAPEGGTELEQEAEAA